MIALDGLPHGTNTIYALRHIESGRAYVGSTWSLKQRIRSHLHSAKKKHAPLYDAMRAHGIDAFELVIVATGLADAERYDTEFALIARLAAKPAGVYNRRVTRKLPSLLEAGLRELEAASA